MEIADGKRGNRLRRARTELLRVPVPDGTFFYVLRASRRMEPNALFSLAARCAPDVLTALPIPREAAVRRFVPRVFPLHRASAALCAILPRTRLPPRSLTVGAFDPGAALCGRTQPLLPLAADVRIVTNDPNRFEPDVAAARRQFGASLTVGKDASLLACCDAVVCPSPDAAFASVPVVLSCVPADGAFSLLPVDLPERFARLRPEAAPPDLFAAALAEKCGVRVAELYACAGVMFGKESMDILQAAALWRARVCTGLGKI